MTSRLLRHTAAIMRAHNVLRNSYDSITVEMNHCSIRRVRFALLYIEYSFEKILKFLPYSRSVGSWMSYTQDAYMSHGTEYNRHAQHCNV
jgi:hypothetical protein